MKTIKTKLFIMQCTITGNTYVRSYEAVGDVLLGTHEVEVPIPELSADEVKKREIAALNDEKAEVDTLAQERISRIDEKLAELRK